MKGIVMVCGLLSSASSQQYGQDPIANLVPTYGADLQQSGAELLPSYSELDSAAAAPMSGEDMLRMSVPGEPGEDYPIYSEVPETGFACDGQVNGGYYSDPKAECQAFHVCTADGTGGLAKYSFLCPNGTLFNQANFVCEYWFNVDCSQAESLYGLNDQIGVSEGSGSLDSSASSPQGGYAAPSAPAYTPDAPAAPAYTPPAPAAPAYTPPASAASAYTPSAPEDSYAAASEPASYQEEVDEYGPADEALPSYGEERRGRKEKGDRVRAGKQSPLDRPKSNRKQNPGAGSRKVPAIQKGQSIGRKGRNRQNSQPGSRGLSQRKPAGNGESRAQGKEATGKVGRTQGQARRVVARQGVRAGRTRAGLRDGKGAEAGKDREASGRKVARPEAGRGAQRGSKAQTQQRVNGRGGSRENRQGRKGKGRGGRQEESYSAPALDTGYGAPAPDYDGPVAVAAPAYVEPADYEYEDALPTYSGASSTAGQSSYVAPLPADTSYAAGSADTSYGAPPPEDYDDTLGQAEYEDDVLPSYNNGVYTDGISGDNYAAPVAEDSYNAPLDTGYGAPAAADTLGQEDYEGDVLPSYNNGVYTDGSSGDNYAAPEAGDSYNAPLDTGYGAPAAAADTLDEEDYEEDILPSYNNGVYTDGSSGDNYAAPEAGDSYNAPLDTGYGAPAAADTLGQEDYEEDVLPSYNNGVYTDGSSGDNYAAPDAEDSYSAPLDTGYGAPAASAASQPALGGYSDPSADILPEYFKSEINLGLNGAADVPRVEPFLTDYGVPQDTYAAASSYTPVKVRRPAATPDLSYGVPAAPTISLADYNIPEVSDIGFTGLGGSSYGG